MRIARLQRVMGAVVALALLGLAQRPAAALGADFPKEELARQGQLVKGQIPVHGFFVNWTDTFFYSGDLKALNAFLEAYGKMAPGHRLEVVFHSGTTNARSPWGTPHDDIPADWSFYRWNTGSSTPDPEHPAPSRVDIWLGTKFKRADIRVPGSAKVTEPTPNKEAPASPS